jgi:hypothetical protein
MMLLEKQGGRRMGEVEGREIQRLSIVLALLLFLLVNSLWNILLDILAYFLLAKEELGISAIP